MIEFRRLDTEEQLLALDLDGFAKSFDHVISRVFPIWIATDEGKLLSYCYVRNHVTAYPAIHPHITPRKAYELSWRWLSKLKEETGDPIIVLPEKFTEKLLSKLPLKPIGGKVYFVRD